MLTFLIIAGVIAVVAGLILLVIFVAHHIQAINGRTQAAADHIESLERRLTEAETKATNYARDEINHLRSLVADKVVAGADKAKIIAAEIRPPTA